MQNNIVPQSGLNDMAQITGAVMSIPEMIYENDEYNEAYQGSNYDNSYDINYNTRGITNDKFDLGKLFLKEDYHVIELIENNKGAIFGGYLRDIIAGDIPNDIDVAISQYYFMDFDRSLINMGYFRTPVGKDHYHYNKCGSRMVDVVVVEDDPNDTLISSVADVDFDVNVLNYTRGMLTDPTGRLTTEEIFELIDRIKRKEARVFSEDGVSEERMRKMERKGYRIVN